MNRLRNDTDETRRDDNMLRSFEVSQKSSLRGYWLRIHCPVDCTEQSRIQNVDNRGRRDGDSKVRVPTTQRREQAVGRGTKSGKKEQRGEESRREDRQTYDLQSACAAHVGDYICWKLLLMQFGDVIGM